MREFYKKVIFVLVGLLIVGSALFLLVRQDDGNLKVAFLDVGQGDAILISTPSGHTILIDGGPDSSVVGEVGRALPFYDHTIDLMVLTHAHADHVSGLVDILERYQVNRVLYNGVPTDAPYFTAWQEIITEKNIPVTISRAGQVFTFGEVAMTVLYPFDDVSDEYFDNLNDSSVVTRLVYQDTSFLFTGDAPAGVERYILERYDQEQVDSMVLKVGHHGSKYSSTLAFLQAVDPLYAVIQSGRDNKFGHPHEVTLRRLKGLGIKVFRNDEVGDINIVSDGKSVWVGD